jgi:hypothetical protein
VTGLGELNFRQLGQAVYSGQPFETYVQKYPNNFPPKKLFALILTKVGLGDILGEFYSPNVLKHTDVAKKNPRKMLCALLLTKTALGYILGDILGDVLT